MYDFRANPTENCTARIIWQYTLEDELKFNVHYKFNGLDKYTEIVFSIKNVDVRVECKYMSAGSNFDSAIVKDIITLNHCKEDNVLFVLNGEGFENNARVEALISELKSFTTKNIDFVKLSELDSYMSNRFNMQPNWNKRKIIHNLLMKNL